MNMRLITALSLVIALCVVIPPSRAIYGSTARISSPANGETVAGTVLITTDVSPEVNLVEFYVDGVLQSTDTVAPYEFSWNSTVNPLPAPNHSMDYGYYFVEWKDTANFDQFRRDVNPYTNLYYAALSAYNNDTPDQFIPSLDRSLSNAVREGKRIHLNLEWHHEFLHPYLDAVFDTAARYWSNLIRIELIDEPDPNVWTRQKIEELVNLVNSTMAARGLPPPPQGLGVNYAHRQPLPDSINAAGLSWIGIEGYLDGPGSPISQVNIDNMTASVRQKMAQVPAGRKIVLVMQAYDRSGTWTNIDTLRDLEVPLYLLGYDDARVVGLNIFSYARAGGTFFHPELKTPHKLIGEKILGNSVPGAGLGPRTLSIRAVDTSGGILSDRITVTATGTDSVGVFRDGIWYLRNSNTTGIQEVDFGFGAATDIPIVGDWNGDGVKTPGVFRNGIWYLRNSNSTAPPDLIIGLGDAGDIPVAGDWNGDGVDTIGVYRRGTWYLRNSNASGNPDLILTFGSASDIPVFGDWNGDGVDTIGVFRNGLWYLRNSNTTGNVDLVVGLGDAGDIPVVGDWNGDGVDTIGVFRQGIWYLRNSNTSGPVDITTAFGAPSDKPVVGDWDGR